MRAQLVVTCLLAAALLAAAVNDVIVKNNKLFVNGEEYIVKGMAYNPAPISFTAGTGLCSPILDPAGNWASACYDSDFWDGNTYPTRNPPGPAGGWFSPLWERDLAAMAAMGVNTLRIYNVNPSNLLAYENYDGQYKIMAPGKDHRPFLDACAAHGLKVLWPLYADANVLLTEPEPAMEFFMRTAIDEAGNHSALLMYAVGNELNYVDKGNHTAWVYILGRVATLMNYARNYQQTRWGRKIPFTTVTDDNNLYYDWLMSILPLDVFTANAGYRAQVANNIWGFFDLWSGNPAQGFSGFHALSCKYQVPLLIGEMNPVGYQDPPNGTEYPTGFPQLWQDLMTHVSQGAIGGFFFEWTDENWKAFGKQDQLGLHTMTVACNNGACSDQLNVYLADTATKKDWAFNAVCCGSIASGAPYNYGMDPFSIIGRPAQTLPNVSQDCPSSLWSGTVPTRANYTSQYLGLQTVGPTSSPVTSSPPPSTAATTSQPPTTQGTRSTPPPTTSAPSPPPVTPTPSPSAVSTTLPPPTPPPSRSPTTGRVSLSSAPTLFSYLFLLAGIVLLI